MKGLIIANLVLTSFIVFCILLSTVLNVISKKLDKDNEEMLNNIKNRLSALIDEQS